MNTKLLCLLLAAFLVVANCQSSKETQATGNQAQGQAGADVDTDNDPEDQADGPDMESEIESEIESEVESEVDESDFDAADVEEPDDVEDPEVMAGNNRNAAENAAGQSSGDVVVANQANAVAAIHAEGGPADDNFVRRESAAAKSAGKTVGLVIAALSAVVIITVAAVYALRRNRIAQGSMA